MDEFYRIKRLPPYVFAIVNDLKSKARARGEDVIDLGMGNPDLGTPKHIVAKLVEAAQNPKNHRYSASRGITRLRRAITKWYGARYDVAGLLVLKTRSLMMPIAVHTAIDLPVYAFFACRNPLPL